MKREREFKVITLGESGVGKTSIINRICDETFNEYEKSTNLIDVKYFVRDYPKKKYEIEFYII